MGSIAHKQSGAKRCDHDGLLSDGAENTLMHDFINARRKTNEYKLRYARYGDAIRTIISSRDECNPDVMLDAFTLEEEPSKDDELWEVLAERDLGAYISLADFEKREGLQLYLKVDKRSQNENDSYVFDAKGSTVCVLLVGVRMVDCCRSFYGH